MEHLASTISHPQAMIGPALSAADEASSLISLLLPSFAVLLVIDIGVRISYRPQQVHCTASEDASQPGSPSSLKTLSISASEVLRDFKHLEETLASEKSRCNRPRVPRLRTLSAPHSGELVRKASDCVSLMPHLYTHFRAEANQSGQISSAFAAFCERLILMNNVWRQEKQLKDLRKKVRVSEHAKCSNAFKAFCDRLVLTNKIWKLEAEARELVAEGERLKRSRVAAVTRAAKKMVEDVRKERLIEEFVQDLLVDVKESKKSVVTLREQHEREIQEITGEWMRDYRRLLREVQQLRLALKARLLEQEISNDMEQSLHDRLSTLQCQADSMQVKLKVEQSSADTFTESAADDYSDDETLSGDPEMLTDVSTSTCVSLQTQPGKLSSSPRRRTVSESQRRPSVLRIPLRPVKRQAPHVSPSMRSPDRKLNPGSYAGFSFNPLFFGPPESKSTPTNKEAAMEPRTREPTPVLPRISKLRYSSSTASLPQLRTTTPWRV